MMMKAVITTSVLLNLPLCPHDQQRCHGKRRFLGQSLIAHLSCLVASHNKHFGFYSHGKEQATQLAPAKVWKPVYEECMQLYPSSPFVEETWGGRSRQTFKGLKACTSNDEFSNKASLQFAKVMETLNCTHGHATRNVLKRRKSITNRCSTTFFLFLFLFSFGTYDSYPLIHHVFW